MAPFLLIFLIVPQFYVAVNCEKADAEKHFESILGLYKRFRNLDQEAADISNEDPANVFIDTYVKPLQSELKEFSESIKSVRKDFSESDLLKVKDTQDSLLSRIADLEIQFSNSQAEGDRKRDEVVKKIDTLLMEMKELAKAQAEQKLEPGLDDLFSSTFEPYGHHSLSTLIEMLVLKMSMGLIKDLPESLKQLMEESGEAVNDENIKAMTKEELTNEVAERLILKKNDGMTPSNFLSKMITTLEDISEFFKLKSPKIMI